MFTKLLLLYTVMNTTNVSIDTNKECMVNQNALEEEESIYLFLLQTVPWTLDEICSELSIVKEQLKACIKLNGIYQYIIVFFQKVKEAVLTVKKEILHLKEIFVKRINGEDIRSIKNDINLLYMENVFTSCNDLISKGIFNISDPCTSITYTDKDKQIIDKIERCLIELKEYISLCAAINDLIYKKFLSTEESFD